MSLYDSFGRVYKKHFIKRVNKRHFMIKFQGFGMSIDVIEELEREGVTKVVHGYERSNGSIVNYLTTLKKFKESSLELAWDGKDLQRFVPVKEMVEIDLGTYVW